jgi:hypothetical protein
MLVIVVLDMIFEKRKNRKLEKNLILRIEIKS